jgi:NAD(P)H-dependent FMN reductase
MKILAFAASNSRKSINKQLIHYATNQIESANIEILDINDYEMPLYSPEREEEWGQPELAHAFRKKISGADALIISFAEHNGSYTAAYKNLFDWTSRIDTKVFQDKPMLLLATSPGRGGARNVLATAKKSAPHFGGNVIGDLSIPSFFDNVDEESGEITDTNLRDKLKTLLNQLIQGTSAMDMGAKRVNLH